MMLERAKFYAAYGRTGSSARVRMFDWIDHLGLDVEVETYRDSSDNKPVNIVRDPRTAVSAEFRLFSEVLRRPQSTAFISRGCSPFSNGSREAAILRRAGHGVYDFDDAIMVPRTDAIGRVFSSARVWRQAVAAADVVIAGNEFLADLASSGSRDVRMVPSCVEMSDYLRRGKDSFDREAKLVWIGSPSTEKYLSSIAGALSILHQRFGTRLVVISAGERPIPGVPDVMVERVQWGEDSFAQSLTAGDIGVMPLIDSEWEKGKCAYKILQYGAAGLPVVASAVGANVAACDRLGGASVRSDDEWVDALTDLISASPSARWKMGERARLGVESHYSFDAWSLEWRQAVGV